MILSDKQGEKQDKERAEISPFVGYRGAVPSLSHPCGAVYDLTHSLEHSATRIPRLVELDTRTRSTDSA